MKRKKRQVATPEIKAAEHHAREIGKSYTGRTIRAMLRRGGVPTCTAARVSALLTVLKEIRPTFHPESFSNWFKVNSRLLRVDELRWQKLLNSIALGGMGTARLMHAWKAFTDDQVPTEDLPTAAAQLDVVQEIARRRRAIKAWSTRRAVAAQKRRARALKAWATRRAKAQAVAA